MAIPKYHELYRDFLNALADEKPHSISDIRQKISQDRNMTEKELQQVIPSGKKTVFVDRIHWTCTYLLKAGLVTRVSRGKYSITQEGKKIQQSPSITINNKFLMRYSSFADFFNSTRNNVNTVSSSSQETETPETTEIPEVTETMAEIDEDTSTPQDTIETAFQKINSALADELMSEIMTQSPYFFERLVVQLLLKMGYGDPFDGAGIVTRSTGDGGIDGIIKEDKLGFSQIYIQAKRWNPDTTVSRPEIQKFSGALRDEGASRGLFITTAHFSKGAEESAKRQHIVLVDGDKLTKLMIEYDIGVSVSQTYSVKKLDSDFFSDD